MFEREGWQGGAIISESDLRNVKKKRKSSKGSSTNRPVLFDDEFVHRIDFSLQDLDKTWRYEQPKELQLIVTDRPAGAEPERAPQVSEFEVALAMPRGPAAQKKSPVDAASVVPTKSHAGQKPAVEQLDSSGISGDTQKASDLDDASVGAVQAEVVKKVTDAITAVLGAHRQMRRPMRR